MKLPTIVKDAINCIDLDHFSEELLGREFDRAYIEEIKIPFGPSGIDTKGECMHDLGFN